MNKVPKIFVALVAQLLVVATAAWVGMDAIQFHQIAAGEYDTPWYDHRFFVEPYTAIRVKLAGPVELWTQNAEGSQNWLVREAKINGKTFWTVLDKRAVPPGSGLGVAHRGL